MKRCLLYASAAIVFCWSPVCYATLTTNADLAVSNFPSTSTLAQGQQVTFSISLINFGPSNVTSAISVTNYLSPGLQYVSDTGGSTNGVYNAGTGIWSVPGLMVGAIAHISITASATGVGVQTNIVTVGSPPGYFDPNL